MLELNIPQSSYLIDTSPMLQIITFYFTLLGYEPFNLDSIMFKMRKIHTKVIQQSRSYYFLETLITLGRRKKDAFLISEKRPIVEY